MGAVQLPDHIRDIIGRQVAEGRFASEAAFLEEAVIRLAQTSDPANQELWAAVDEGRADYVAGRFTTLDSREDLERFMDGIIREIEAEAGASGVPGRPPPAAPSWHWQ